MDSEGTQHSVSAADQRELGARWAKARLAALGGSKTGVPEPELLSRMVSEDEQRVLKRVFDYSLALGKSFAAHHGIVLERDDLHGLCENLGVECLTRRVVHEPCATRMERARCAAVGDASASFACRFYREAFDGLVLGLSDGEVFFRRHRSVGSGDAVCLDVLFDAPAANDVFRFGSIPPELQPGLDAVRDRLRIMPGVSVRFAGVSEGVLSYEVTSDNSELALDGVVREAVKRRFPSLRLQNIAPRAVLTPQ